MFNFTLALDRNADRWSDREAVVFEDRRLTNAALADRVNSLAAGLAELGVGATTWWPFCSTTVQSSSKRPSL